MSNEPADPRGDQALFRGFGNSNDYVVLDGGRVIGRILLHPQGPEGHPWFWSITAMEKPPSVYNKGYSATREQAMADFKARWSSTEPELSAG